MLQKIALFIFIFFLSMQIISDPDFGWHLRAGQYIVENQTVPKHDLFSFTLPNYSYVYHSWAAEAILFIVYKYSGLLGATIFFALVLTLGIYLLYKTSQIARDKITIYPVFLFSTLIAWTIAGGRMRIFNLLFLSLVYFLVKAQWKNPKIIFLIPLIFLLWVNFHGSFALGIFILPLLLWNTKTTLLSKITVFLLSTLATFANPYFLAAWKQALQIPFNSYLHIATLNADWQSLLLVRNGWVLAIIFAAVAILTLAQKPIVANFEKILIILFLILSLVSSRFAIFLFVFLVPAANSLFANVKMRLAKDVKNSTLIRFAPQFIYLVLFLFATANILEIVSVTGSLKKYSDFINQKATGTIPYKIWPYEANQYLAENLKDKRTLNEGNVGGFLLLQYPEVKLFSYGAMDNFFVNGKSFAFEYYRLIRAEGDWQQKLIDYRIEAVFLPKSFPLIKKLKTDPAWQTAYDDNQTVILVKN